MIRLPTELSEIVKQGGTVVVPSRQRAHAARLAHAAAEIAKGRAVWATPDILPVEAWLTREIERYAATAGTGVPRLLSPAEEWFLWRQCAAEATGELELVNRGALAEALRRASAIAADYGINVRGVVGPRANDVGPSRSIASWSEPGSESDSESGTEAALLAEVQRAVDERCQSLGAATVASLTERLRSGIESGLRHGGEARVVGSGFLTIPPRLRSLVSPSREMGAAAAVAPNAIIAADELDELERIAQWCKQHIEANPDARILIMLPGAPGTRERLATLIRQAVRPGAWFRTEANAADTRAPKDARVPTQPDQRPRLSAGPSSGAGSDSGATSGGPPWPWPSSPPWPPGGPSSPARHSATNSPATAPARRSCRTSTTT